MYGRARTALQPPKPKAARAPMGKSSRTLLLVGVAAVGRDQQLKRGAPLAASQPCPGGPNVRPLDWRRMGLLVRRNSLIAVSRHSLASGSSQPFRASRGSGQRGRGAVLEERHLGGEGPAVVGLAGEFRVHLVGAERVGVDAAVGIGRGIAEMRVLPQRGLDDAHDRVADGSAPAPAPAARRASPARPHPEPRRADASQPCGRFRPRRGRPTSGRTPCRRARDSQSRSIGSGAMLS